MCILFNNNFSFHILKTISDPKGRFVIVDIKTESKTLTLANIYAPNNDDPFFFENVFKHLLTFECEEIILGGDFKLVLVVQKDKKGGNPVTNEKSLQKVKYIVDLAFSKCGYKKFYLKKTNSGDTMPSRLFLNQC